MKKNGKERKKKSQGQREREREREGGGIPFIDEQVNKYVGR